MIALGSSTWGSSPTIGVSFAYEKQRNGAAMQYRVQATINPVTGASYFGFPIYLAVTINGTTAAPVTLKNASPSQWSSAIVYTSNWITVENKTTGTTPVSFRLYSGSGSSRNTTYSYAMAVDPAASTLHASNGTLGTVQTLALTKYDSGFTTTITYVCGNAFGTIASKSAATSFSFTPPMPLASQNTTGENVQIVLTATTYSGSSVIGEYSTSISAAIPTSVVPTVSISVSDDTGNYGKYGAFVQGQSVLTLNADASPAYGSPIRRYSVSADGKSYSSASVTASTPVSNSGTLTATARVTDARGRTSEQASQSFTVLPWQRPSAVASAIRCNADGTVNETGLYAKVTFSASVSPVSNKNTAAYTVQYRPEGSSAWTTVNVADQAGKYTVTNASIIFAAPETTAFEVQVIAQDAFASTTTYTAVSIAFRLINASPGGHDIAFGMMSGNGKGFEVNMDATFYGGMTFPNGSPFAPSGYGLGEYNGKILGANDDLNSARENGWYACNKAKNAPISYGTCLVSAYGSDNTCQMFFGTASDSAAYRSILIRWRLWGGDWGEWGWLTPPMSVGVEYRTTERSAGQPVYIKRVQYTTSATIGSSSAVTDVDIPHNISGFAQLVRCDARTGSTAQLPYNEKNGASTSVIVVDNTAIKLRIINTTWNSGRMFTFDIRYTKS